jgi:hypothetical protein
MKKINFIILMFSLFSFCSFSQKKEVSNIENIEIPDDFYFVINDGRNDNYNSQYNNFYREYLDDNDKTIKVELTKTEKERIYSLMRKIDFYGMPNAFEPQEKIILISTPSHTLSVVIYSNGKKKYVSYDTGATSDQNKKRAKPFLEFYEMIWNIIYSKEEVMKLQQSNITYK